MWTNYHHKWVNLSIQSCKHMQSCPYPYSLQDFNNQFSGFSLLLNNKYSCIMFPSPFTPKKRFFMHHIFLLKKQVKNWAENFKFRLSTDDINELSLTPNGVQPTEPLSYQNPLFLLWQNLSYLKWIFSQIIIGKKKSSQMAKVQLILKETF